MEDRFETVIGLEIHVQLDTRTKLFCGCRNRTGAPPNTDVCAVCYALPGTLPVPNARAVELAVRAALALECEVADVSIFERKNYFYPDLPKGYQITQYAHPLARDGGITIGDRRIRIHRIQIEEDAGKLVHGGFGGPPNRSGVDFNRAGVPLIEIVTEPDLRSPAETEEFARVLRSRLRYCAVSDTDMEKGNLRMDGNISVRCRGDGELGAKVEVKNVNSFRFLRRALEFEELRQRQALETGDGVRIETRQFREDRGVTEVMRTKEAAADYRYFPDPDLPPLRLPDGLVRREREQLPEFPRERAARFMEVFGMRPEHAGLLVARREVADYFEAAVRAASSAAGQLVAGWILQETPAEQREAGAFRTSPERLGGLLQRVASGQLARNLARDAFALMDASGVDADEAIRRLGIDAAPGESDLRALADRLVARHPDDARAYREGRGKVLGFFVGKAMKELRGKADARAVRGALQRALDKPEVCQQVPEKPEVCRQVPGESAASRQVSDDPVANRRVSGDPVASRQVLDDPVPSWRVPGDPVASRQVSGESAASRQVSGESAASRRVSDDPVANRRMSNDPVANRRVSGDPVANRRVSDDPVA